MKSREDIEVFVRNEECKRWFKEHPHNSIDGHRQNAWVAAWGRSKSVDSAITALEQLQLRVVHKGYSVGIAIQQNKATGAEEWSIMFEPYNGSRIIGNFPSFSHHNLKDAIESAENYFDLPEVLR
jgi:hypothetical protein